MCNLYWGAFNPATFFSLREINLFSIRKGSRFELNSRRYDFLEITNLVTPPASRPYAEDGLAVNATLTEPTGSEIDGDVPTLPEWGMILLGTLLLGIGYRKQGGGGVGMPARLASLLAALLILPLLANSPAALANETLTYDPNDNRLTDGSGAKTYSPNSDRLVTENGQSITLDPAGNVTQARGLNFVWNQRAGQIKTVSQGATLLATYTYDYQGLRSRKTTTAAAPQGAGTVIYAYDLHDRLKGEFDGAGNPLRTYVWRDDVPVSIILHGTPETVLYLETDHLNTPIAARDQTGKVVWKWESDAFGSTLPNEDPDGDTQNTTINLRFPGQYFDRESGLHYNWNRYYDPRLGRYLSPDPIGLAGGANLYQYGKSNPLSYSDPKGLNPLLGLGLRLLAMGLTAHGAAENPELGLAGGLGSAAKVGGQCVAKGASEAERGGLTLFKWGKDTTTKPGGWKEGDFMLNLPDKGSAQANWAQNAGRLREQMRQGNPIYDSYRDVVTGKQIPTEGFLRAERNLLESRGWQYNSSTGGYHPPGP